MEPIGIIHSPFKEPKGTPVQPGKSGGAAGTIEVYPQFAAGLADLDGFSHIILVYNFHLSRGFELVVTPFLDNQSRGLFATRAPRRPNPIGLSVVQLDRIAANVLHVIGIDIVDGTPLWDIKPYVPEFDSAPVVRIGWLTGKTDSTKVHRADERFQ